MTSSSRDLRLDFFRGLALVFIFLDHIPDNLVSYFTLANIVFSDAAEIFVFLSGYTAALVFGAVLAQNGTIFTIAQVLKRCWTLYVAHIFLFVVFVAQVSYTAAKFDNPMFLDEMKVWDFLQEPHTAILQALALRFQPHFLDILPLYIVLLLAFSFILPLLRLWPWAVLAASGALYLAATIFRFNLHTYPEGVWYFNPFAWQILFVVGAALALADAAGRRRLREWPGLIWLSAGFLVFCVLARTAMTAADFFEATPGWAAQLIWLIGDKVTLGPLRLLNFLALAHVTVTVLRKDHTIFRSPFAEPVILCGQHSLNIFCLGIFLSFLGHFVLVEISQAIPMHLAVSAAGTLIMFGTAYFLTWSKQRRRPAGEGAKLTGRAPQAAPQGGE
jgi:hypothetical protein